MKPHLKLAGAGTSVLLLAAATSSLAVTASAPVLPPPAAPQEILAGGKGLAAIVGALRNAGHDEANYRAEAGRTESGTVKAGATPYAITTSSRSAARALATGPAGSPLTLFTPVPCPAPAAQSCQALVMLSGTRLSLLALYSGLPSDARLAGELAGAVNRNRRPLAVFDPKFVPTGPPGPDRYRLK